MPKEASELPHSFEWSTKYYPMFHLYMPAQSFRAHHGISIDLIPFSPTEKKIQQVETCLLFSED